jgi:putative copper export protein
LALGAAAAVIEGEASHAADVRPVWLGLTTNAVHTVAMGLWIGVMASLLILCRHNEAAPFLRSMTIRFGRITAFCVPASALSGALLSFMIVGHVSGSLSTAYGKVLIQKLSVMAAAVVYMVMAGKDAKLWLILAFALLAVILLLSSGLVTLPPS